MQTENDGRNDFDFLIGTWKVHHRTLKKRLSGSTEWMEFEGDMVSRKILNGLGNMDENLIHAPTGPVHAVAFRLFNPESKEWSIYWSTDQTGILDVPVIGGFQDGRGEFYSQEVFRRPAHLQPLHLVKDHAEFCAMGTGIFRRWRQNLGNELDHGI